MPLPPLVEPGPPLSREQVARYSRHLLLDQLGDLGQRRLLAGRVLVMGAGGLGSPVLLYLAAAGVGTIGVVDLDAVDTTNLQRQVIHSTADIGRPKVDSAAERVRAVNPDVKVVRHHVHLDATNAREIIGSYDLVIDGTDNFPTRYLVNDVCADLGLPLVWGSILRFDAQVAVFWARPPAAAAASSPAYPAVTLRDLFPAPPPPGTTPSCGQAGVLGAMCGQVGSLMAAEAVKLLTGAGEPLLGRVAVLDVLAARWSEIPLRPRPGGTAPTTLAQLGYDPHGTAVTAAAAPLCTVPDGRPEPGGHPAPDGRPEPGRRPEQGGRPEPDGQPGTTTPEITAPVLAERLTARERGQDSLVLIDVREPAERTIVAIPGAVAVPLGQLLADPAGAAAAAGAGPADHVVVHCLSGGRSAQAQAALLAAGYADVVNLSGGVRAWVDEVDPSLPTY